jgi:hypothetical protein
MEKHKKLLFEQVIPAQAGYYLVHRGTLEHEIRSGRNIDEVVKEALSKNAHPIIAWRFARLEEYQTIEPLTYTLFEYSQDAIIIAPNGWSYKDEEWGETLKAFVELHILEEKKSGQ